MRNNRKTSAEEIGRMIDAIIQNVSLAVDSTEAGAERVEEGLVAHRKDQ